MQPWLFSLLRSVAVVRAMKLCTKTFFGILVPKIIKKNPNFQAQRSKKIRKNKVTFVISILKVNKNNRP